jgi:tRNA A-37 threonylcarbamoyl transferase component Bud32
MAGEVLGGRYELMEPIGRGGMATIYRARDRRMNRVVAIKVLREVYSTDRKFITRFQMEARAASSLTHPNIVQVYDYGQSADSYYIVMELIQGNDLRRYLRVHHILDVDQAVAIAHDVALGLGAAHRRQIVHRDVKPQNILVNGEGLVKLTDFGIASMYKDLSAERLTTTGMTLGTVQYYAPEQAQGEIVSPAADVYALGIVLYEMLTGKPPFDGDTPVSVAVRHIQDLPEPPSHQNPKIPAGLEALILRCLEKDPRDRYADGDTLAEALDNYEAEEPHAASGPYEYGPKNVVQAGQGSGAIPMLPPRDAPRASSGLRGSGGGLLSGQGSGLSGLGGPGMAGRPRSGLGMGVGAPGRTTSRPLPPPEPEEDEEGDWDDGNTWQDERNGLAPNTRPRPAAAGTLPRSPVPTRPLPRRSSRTTVMVTSLIVAATVLLLGLSCYLASQLGLGAGLFTSITGGQATATPTLIQVPNVITFTEDVAISTLRGKHLQVNPVLQATTKEPKGIVFDQKPESADAPVAPNTVVTIYVSQGPPSVAMPDVIGMNKDDALTLLRDKDHQFNVTVIVKDSPQPENKVIDQDPLKGTSVAVGQSVTITVSHFVQPTPTPTNTPVPQPSPSPTPIIMPTATGFGPGKGLDV